MNLGTLTVTLGVDSSGLVRANTAMTTFAKKTTTSLNTMGQRLRTFGYLSTATLTMPIVMASKAVTKLAMDYETSLTKVVGLVGIARTQVNAWSDDILKMAPEVGKGPKELADALYFITSAGIRGAEAMDVLRVSAMASAGGLGETKKIADLVTSAMNAYGIANLSAAQATDVLVSTVREGKSEATALASTIGMVLPIASAMGVKFHEVGAAVAAMTRTGTKATTASMQLRQMLNSLIKPSKGAEDALAGMGTSSEALRKSIREKGLLSVLMQLKQLSEIYGETVMAKVFPNIRALSGVLDILGKNLGDNIKIFDSLANSAGATDRVFAEASQTMEFRFNRALSKVQVQMVSIGKIVGNYILPIFEKWVGKIERLVEKFNSLSERQQRFRLNTLKHLALLGPLTMAFSILSYTISGTISLFTMLGKSVIFVTSMIRGLTGGLMALRPAMAANSGLTRWLVGAGRAAKVAFSAIGIEGAAVLGALGLVIVPTILLIKNFRKATQDAKEAQNSFNDVLVKVNDNIVQMKNLTAVDYSKMNFMQLGELKAGAVAAKLKIYREIESKVKELGYTMDDVNRKKMVGGREVFAVDFGKYEEFIRIKAIAFSEADAQVKLMDDALDTLADKFGLLTEEEIKALVAWNKEIADLIQSFEDEGKYIDNVASIMKGLGIEYDVAGTKASMFLGQINKLLKEGLTPQSEEVKNIINQYKALRKEIEESPIAKVDTSNIFTKSTPSLDYLKKENTTFTGLYKGQFGQGGEWTKQKAAIDKYNESLKITDGIITKLGDTFEAMFTNIGGGFKGMIESFIDSIRLLLAQLVGKTILLLLANLFAPGSGFAVAAFTNLYKFTGGIGFASGGIVPPGYPNDSYPAMLTSGETVLPKSLSGAAVQSKNIHITVDGKLHGRDIYLSNERYSKILNDNT